MSGVVYGLLGYVWAKGRYEPGAGLGLQDGTALIMMVWLVLGFTGLLGAVANYTHAVGLLMGVIAGAGRTFLRRHSR
ncbi:MAG: rhomboid family intramembrane serine protease [Myxococcota bacterium]